MKTEQKKYIIEALIFFLIVGSALFIFRPTAESVKRRLENVKKSILVEIEEKFGVTVNYSSISPSLFRIISVRNVSIHSTSDSQKIASVDKILIKYNILSLILNKYGDIIDNITICDGYADIDTVKHKIIFDKINSLSKKSDEASLPQKNIETKSFFKKKFSLSNLKSFNIFIRNLALTVKKPIGGGKKNIFHFSINTGTAFIDDDKLNFNLNSFLDYTSNATPSSGIALKGGKVAVNAKGSFLKSLDSGSAIVSLDIKGHSAKTSEAIGFFVSYGAGLFRFVSMKNIRPLEVNAFWDINSNHVGGFLACNDLKPLSLFNFYFANSRLEALKTASVTGNINFDFQTINQWNFQTNVKLNVPKVNMQNYVFEGADILVTAEGKDGNLNFKKVKASGKQIDLTSSISFNIETKKANGNMRLIKLSLPNGQTISANINVTHNNNRIKAGIPYIKIGSSEISNINLQCHTKKDKVDFYLKGSDEKGKFELDGSVLFPTVNKKNAFLEVHGAFDAVSVSNLFSTTQALSEIPQNSQVVSFLKNLQLTTEFYISSDFNDFSYNFIQIVIASSEAGELYTVFSLNGNKSSFDISNINIAASGLDITGNIKAGIDKNDMFFNSFLTVNSIVYKAAALYSDKSLTVYGDYGFAVNIFFYEKDSIKGTLLLNEMPLPIINTFISADSSFNFSGADSWNVFFNSLKFVKPSEDTGGGNIFKIELSGNADQTGAFFPKAALDSREGALSGEAFINRLPETENGIKKLETGFSLKSPDDLEKFLFDSKLTFSENIYFDGSFKAENISLSRFFLSQGNNNKIDAVINFLGTPDNFFAKLDLNSFIFAFKGEDIKASATAAVDDGCIKLKTADISWGEHKVSDIEAYLSHEDSEGKLSLKYSGNLGGKDAGTNLNIAFSSARKKDKEGKSKSENLLESVFNQFNDFNLKFMLSDTAFGSKVYNSIEGVLTKDSNAVAVYLGKEEKTFGWYVINDGTLSLQVDEALPVRCNLDGKFTENEVDIDCNSIYVDIPLLWDLTPLTGIVSFEKGAVQGNLKITGTQKDPEFYGDLVCSKVSAYSPQYAPEVYGPVNIPVKLKGNSLSVPYTVVRGYSTDLWASVSGEFSGWIPVDITVNCGTVGKTRGLMKTKNLAFHSNGYTAGDIVINITPELVTLTGKASFDNGYFSIPFGDLYKLAEVGGGKGPDFKMKLDVSLGKKAEFRWPTMEVPILRTLLPTDVPMTLIVDTSEGYFDIKGASKMRGGEILYIKRNFYIREGEFSLVQGYSGFDPIVSLRAEIRDKNSKGEPIKIILTAKEQSLNNFYPVITSDPPSSEFELMQMLGQVFIADASRDTIVQTVLTTATDLAAQIGVFKYTENRIRDFLHLDAFSMRTLLLQNAIFGNMFRTSTDTPLTIGNYFDNTSVYIGKYFGTAIYADALLHLSYYDPLLLKDVGARKPVKGNLLFQPEIGLEMMSPFFAIREVIAPSRADTLFVSDTKLTFSWKFSY